MQPGECRWDGSLRLLILLTWQFDLEHGKKLFWSQSAIVFLMAEPAHKFRVQITFLKIDFIPLRLSWQAIFFFFIMADIDYAKGKIINNGE